MGKYFSQPNKDTFGNKNPNFKTGLAVKGKRSSIYSSWQGMKQRCTNPNNPFYGRYGGRGIKICKEWMEIKGFIDWAFENGWKDGLTIDRIDNDGNYEPQNCKWIVRIKNAQKRSNVKLSFDDALLIRKLLTNGEKEQELAKKFNVSRAAIWKIKNNKSFLPEKYKN